MIKGEVHNPNVRVEKYPIPIRGDYPKGQGGALEYLEAKAEYMTYVDANIASPELPYWEIPIHEQYKWDCIHCNGSGGIPCDFEIYVTCPNCKDYPNGTQVSIKEIKDLKAVIL